MSARLASHACIHACTAPHPTISRHNSLRHICIYMHASHHVISHHIASSTHMHRMHARLGCTFRTQSQCITPRHATSRHATFCVACMHCTTCMNMRAYPIFLAHTHAHNTPTHAQAPATPLYFTGRRATQSRTFMHVYVHACMRAGMV